MDYSLWAENPGIYLGKEVGGGIIISGPVTVKEAGKEVAQAAKIRERVVMYKSENGEWPVLEIIMELLYRNAEG
ncbi:MAG: hypothetical protein ABII21_00610 [bacterium]